MGAVCYLGVPLFDSAQQVIGTLCINNDKPLSDAQFAKVIMGVFAARAAAELQRKWAEESLCRAYDELEIRVCDRTAELSETLRTLESEIADRKRAEEELAERARQSALRSDIGLALTQGGDLSPMLQRCCEPLVEHLDAAFARIWTLNPDEDMLELQASAGLYTHINGPHARVPVGKSKIGLIAL